MIVEGWERHDAETLGGDPKPWSTVRDEFLEWIKQVTPQGMTPCLVGWAIGSDIPKIIDMDVSFLDRSRPHDPLRVATLDIQYLKDATTGKGKSRRSLVRPH